MLPRRAVLLSAMAVLATAPAASAATVAISEPKPLPPIRFEDLAGNETGMEAFRGKVVLLNLWATWCAPCRREMPSLQRLQAMFDPAEFEVVAVSVDRAGTDKVEAFLAEAGVTKLSVYRDPKAAATRTLRAPGLPTSILVDRDGNEVGRVLGDAEWDGDAAVAVIRKLIAG